jgi:hypothetical protein
MVGTNVPFWLGIALILQSGSVQSFAGDKCGTINILRRSNDIRPSTKYVASVGFLPSALSHGPRRNPLATSSPARSRQGRLPSRTTTTSLHLGMPNLYSMQAVLHSDPSFCLTGILLLSAFGISLERRTVIGVRTEKEYRCYIPQDEEPYVNSD